MSRILRLVPLLVAVGCSSSSTQPASQGDYHVRVFNGSPFLLTDIRIATGPGASFTEPRLEHGDLSTDHATTALYTTPAVSANVDGQSLASIPIEGFAGFNPPLSPGSYVVTIEVTGTPRRLEVRVTQPVEERRP